MISQLKSTLRNARDKVLEISLTDCVHYGAFSYDHGYFNPYANYVRDYHQGLSIGEIRYRFALFLQDFIPGDLSEAFCLQTSRKYHTWQMPWSKRYFERWFMNIEDVPDLLTHFSEEGILRHRIEEEFMWLESAYFNVKRFGYRPEEHSYVRIGTFINAQGKEKHLLLDGNHRVSAMLALGTERALVRRHPEHVVYEKDLESWPLVSDGIYTASDAMLFFQAYFNSPKERPVTTRRNRIIDARGNVLKPDFSS